MDYDALKDRWSEVEDHDGIRLSWNTFPSSRMVLNAFDLKILSSQLQGSVTARCTHRGSLHAFEGEARHASTSL